MRRPRVRVKVCCIGSVQEARLAVAHGASALGLVSAMPSGPGVIPERLIATIAAATPPGVATVLLTSSLDQDEIIAQQRRCRVNTLQLCDLLPVPAYARLRSALPGISLMQVIHVVDDSAVEQARLVAGEVDALLLDSGRPQAEVKELGGTGRVHDWSISRRICQEVAIPVFLAGGLTPDNVATAISAVEPYGVDVCTGLRCQGQLSESKLARFFAAAETGVRSTGAGATSSSP